MKTVKSKGLVAAIVLGMMTAFCGVSYAASANTNVAVEVTVQQNVKGIIKWENSSSAKVEAVGLGLPPVNMVGTRGAVLARRAAVVDAYRQIAELINGVQVDAETTMRELVLESDVVRTRTQALIKGARIVEEHTNKDGSYTVKVVLPLFGAGSVASVAIPELKVTDFPVPQLETPRISVPEVIVPKKLEEQNPSVSEPGTDKEEEAEISTSIASASSNVKLPKTSTSGSVASNVEVPIISNNVTDTNIEPKASVNKNAYTGVIVDASGLGLEGTFSPLIYDESGRTIYGMRNIDKEYAISNGMVEYSSNVKDQTRAGNNPLVIKAVGVKGGANSVNKVNVVVSMEDAEKILQANGQSAILDNKAVVFIK